MASQVLAANLSGASLRVKAPKVGRGQPAAHWAPPLLPCRHAPLEAPGGRGP